MRAKKFLSILLALMLVISVIPTSALANEADEDTTPETVEVPPTEPGEETTEPEEPEEPGEEPTEPTEPEDEPVALADGTITSEGELTAAVSAGGDAQLSGDLTAAFPTPVTKDFTLDLGGHTLILSNTGSITVSGGAKLVFKNGTITANSIVSDDEDPSKSAFGITANSSIELERVTFTTNGSGLFPSGENACVKVTDSTVSGVAFAVSTNAKGPENYGVQITLQHSTFTGWSPIMLNVPGTLEMTDCTVNGEMHGVIVRGGTAVIKGCTIKQEYTGNNAQQMASYFEGNKNWGSGNTVNLGALVVGNKNSGSYQYPSDVTLIDTDVSTAGDNAALFPALFVTANQTEENGVTLVYDDDCTFDNGTDNAIQIANDSENAVVGTPVAEVDGTPYVTLQAAIDDADGKTVTLLAEEITEDITVAAGQKITLDLNGKTLKGSVNISGALAVEDSSAAEEPTVDESNDYTVTYTSGEIQGAVSVLDDGTFTLNSGTVTVNRGCAIYTHAGTVNIKGGYVLAQEFCVQAGTGTVNVSGGVMEAKDNAVIGGNGSTGENGYTINMEDGTLIGRITDVSKGQGYGSCGIYHPNGGTLNVSGGKIISTEGAGIVVRSGQTNITGGEIIALGENSFEGKVGDSPVTVPTSGVVLDLAASYPGTNSGEIKVNISGNASVTGAKEALSVIETFNNKTVEENDNVNISAGSFSSAVKDEYCAEGFVPTKADADGKYTVKVDDKKVAKVTSANGVEKAYGSLEDALKNAESGDTVTLLQDVKLSGGDGDTKGLVTITENITLDGQGHTISAVETVQDKTSMINIQGGAKVTVKDVTIDGNQLTKHGININPASDTQTEVTVNNVTIKDGQGYGIVCNSSKLTATDLTTEGNAWGGVNVDSRVSGLGASFTMNSGKIQEKASIVIENDKQNEVDVKAVEVEIIDGSFENVLLQNIDAENAAKLTIKEGSFDAVIEVSKNGETSTQKEPRTGVVEIFGGTFKKEVPQAYCAEDYHPVDIKTTTGTVYTVMKKEYDFQEITVIGPNGEDTLSVIKTETQEDDKVTVVSVQGSEIGKDLMKPQSTDPNWSYQGWTFKASDGTSFGPEKTLTQDLANWLAQKIQSGVDLTMDSKTPGTYIPSPGGSHHSSSSSVTTYPVTVDSAKHGTVTASAKNASRGTTVTITVKADDGYELDGLTVTDKDGKTVKVTEGKNGKFTFTMPASKVTIEADFAKSKETPDQRFTDVPEGYWAEDEINWAAENGYMNGNTATTFNPEGSVTRQQLWMILARLSGYRPADFAEAKAWAVDNSISDGSNPENAVTRQQLVTILYRYAVRMGYKTTGTADLTRFPDHASVAAYAADAMSWSVANGIVGGTSAGTLNPTGTATRAQFAVILYRFCEKVVG